LRKYNHYGIEATDDCKTKINKNEIWKCYVLWIGDREISIDGDLADFAHIRDGITNELQRLGYEDYEQERKRAEGE